MHALAQIQFAAECFRVAHLLVVTECEQRTGLPPGVPPGSEGRSRLGAAALALEGLQIALVKLESSLVIERARSGPDSQRACVLALRAVDALRCDADALGQTVEELQATDAALRDICDTLLQGLLQRVRR